ncbi:MAG: ROK family protein, partial [Rikenellaceae bacterium]
MRKLAVGIDLGGTNTRIGLVDIDGTIVASSSTHTTNYNDVNSFVAYVSHEIRSLCDKIGNVELMGIGIGAPAANYYKGTIDYASDLIWKGVIPIVDIFRSYFSDIPVIVTNDAKGAAMGEMIYGGAKGLSDFMVITLGTGVGSGIVSGGKIIYGQDSFAGELGHAIAVQGGRECGCGRRGCLDVYASASGVRRTAFELLAEYRGDSELRSYSYNDMTSEIISNAAHNGDRIAKEVYKRTGKILGIALANAATVTFPQMIFLFGGLTRAGKLIMEPTRKSFEENFGIIAVGTVSEYISRRSCLENNKNCNDYSKSRNGLRG